MSWLQIMSIQEWVVVCSMFFFLGFAAWFDMHGTEVPDPLTVPYAMLGISAAVLSGRHYIAILASFILLVILLPIRIPGIDRINNWFIRRAYKTEEIEEEMKAHLAETANAFFEKNGERASKWVNVAYTVIPALIAVATIIEPMQSKDDFLFTILSTGGLVMLGRYYRQCNEEEPAQEQEDLPLSSFGGADMIVFLGMWGLYGTELFLLDVLIVCTAYLLYAFLKFRFKREKTTGFPLLPAIFFFAPIRLLLFFLVGQPLCY